MRFEAPTTSVIGGGGTGMGMGRRQVVRSQPVEIPQVSNVMGDNTGVTGSAGSSGGSSSHGHASSPSRTIGTQTPTERLSFVFPDPCAVDATSDDQSGILGSSESPVARRSFMTPSSPAQAINPLCQGNHCNRNLLRGGVLPDVVPGRPRHPLGRRGSDGMLASEVAESVGQELRSIGDAYDRTRITRSRSLSLVSSIFNGRRRLSTSSV